MHWAMTQNNLGAALRDLGARAGDTDALQDAVTAFRAALEVRTREAAPYLHAQTMENLAIARLARATLPDAPDRAADLAAALDAVDDALSVYTPEHTPYDHGTATRLREAILAAHERRRLTPRLRTKPHPSPHHRAQTAYVLAYVRPSAWGAIRPCPPPP
jgi:hypothetical protein